MLLNGKTAIVYGAGGAIGGAVGRAFARDGAKLFLTGRNLAAVDAVAKDIIAEGGAAEAARVDALDERAVEEHLAAVVKHAGRIDVSFNAIGLVPQQGIQGIPLTELSVESFSVPITTYTRAHFLTARAAARRMIEQRSGVILMHTPEPARLGAPLVGGMGPSWERPLRGPADRRRIERDRLLSLLREMTDRHDAILSELQESRQRFLTLVAEVRPELHRYCARMTGSIADGEDVVQDTLARAYYELSELKELPPLRPWLFRIAHNRAIDILRAL